MARVTVEDCVLKVPNRFELVMLASQRARSIGSGAPLTVDRDNDKNPVVALREIADETVSLDKLREQLTKGYQKVIEVDDDDEDVIELMEGEGEGAATEEKSEAKAAAEDAEDAEGGEDTAEQAGNDDSDDSDDDAAAAAAG